MAMNALANAAERLMSHAPSKDTTGANPSRDDYADPSGETMSALCWEGKGSVSMRTVGKPRLVDGHEAIVKVTGTTVCGSDLHLLHGSVMAMHGGDILGHEFAGIVESVGADVDTSKVKVGDRVVCSFQVACGTCWYCKRDLASQCSGSNNSAVEATLYGENTASFLGYSGLCGGMNGGQADYVRVPHADFNLLVLPDNLPFEAGLFLSDVLPTSMNAAANTGVAQGDYVGIWGAGPIGLCCAKWCLLMGAEKVIMVDRGSRLEYAKSKLPAIDVIDFDVVKDVPAALREVCRSQGERPGLDCAIECAAGEYPKTLLSKAAFAVGLVQDTGDIIQEMVLATRSFGHLGLTGVYLGNTTVNVGAIMERGLQLRGNGQCPVRKYWKTILHDYLLTDKFDVVDLILTHRVPIQDTPKVYTYMDNHTDNMIKTFIQTKFSEPPSNNSPPLKSLA